MSFELTFPLWIKPWVSGIYAYDCPSGRGPDGFRIPAVLTAYLDEVGGATMMMHVLDYEEMFGGRIEWCHWEAIRWCEGRHLSIFGVQDEGWNVSHVDDATLSADDAERLQDSFRHLGHHELGSFKVAEALLPHLPSASKLEVWDRNEQLWCCEEPIEDCLEDDYIQYVLERPTIPPPAKPR